MYISYHDGIAICRAGHSARILTGHFVRGADGNDTGIELQVQNLRSDYSVLDTITIRMNFIEGRDLASKILARCLGHELNNDALAYLENELCLTARKIVNAELHR